MAKAPYGLPPGVADAIAKANKALTRISETQLNAAQEAARIVEAYRLDWVRDLAKVVQDARKALVEAWPPNWQEMNPDQTSAALDLAEEGTIPIIWVPPTPILEELLNAQTHIEREAVLSQRRTQLLDAAREAVADSTVQVVPQQAELARFAHEAIAAADSGLDRAAQSLAAGGIGYMIHSVLGYEKLGEAFKEMGERDPGDASIHELRFVSLQIATSNSLTDVDRGPAGFNRHGTQHGDPAHFTEPAMLASLMLLVGWVRELADLAEYHPEVFRSAS
jgi:hypothetical protein